MKTQIQKLSSSKLFYNKWPYKVECTIRGAYQVARYDTALLKAWCQGESNTKSFYFGYGDKNINKLELLTFITAAEPFLKREDTQIRAEGSHFNIFCKDFEVLEHIDNNLHRWVRSITGPTSVEEFNFMIDNGHKKRLCDDLPKGKYKYKLFFKTKFPQDKRLVFASWAAKYQDKLEVGGVTERWLNGKLPWTQSPFMYVEDEKTLSMVGMFISGYVQKVEDFIPRNTISTA